MNKFENSPPQAILYIRILAGGYLMYLAKNLYGDKPDGLLYWIPIIAFAVIGLCLLVNAVRALIRVNRQEAEEAARAAAEAEAPTEPAVPASKPVLVNKPSTDREASYPAAEYNKHKKHGRKAKKKQKQMPDFSEPLPEVIPEFLKREIEKQKSEKGE